MGTFTDDLNTSPVPKFRYVKSAGQELPECRNKLTLSDIILKKNVQHQHTSSGMPGDGGRKRVQCDILSGRKCISKVPIRCPALLSRPPRWLCLFGLSSTYVRTLLLEAGAGYGLYSVNH